MDWTVDGVVCTWLLKVQDVLHFLCISSCSREKRTITKKYTSSTLHSSIASKLKSGYVLYSRKTQSKLKEMVKSQLKLKGRLKNQAMLKEKSKNQAKLKEIWRITVAKKVLMQS